MPCMYECMPWLYACICMHAMYGCMHVIYMHACYVWMHGYILYICMHAMYAIEECKALGLIGEVRARVVACCVPRSEQRDIHLPPSLTYSLTHSLDRAWMSPSPSVVFKPHTQTGSLLLYFKIKTPSAISLHLPVPPPTSSPCLHLHQRIDQVFERAWHDCGERQGESSSLHRDAQPLCEELFVSVISILCAYNDHLCAHVHGPGDTRPRFIRVRPASNTSTTKRWATT